MKIAVSDKQDGYESEWVNACIQRGIEIKKVNPYQTDIIDQLSGCDAFMWHHSHGNYRDLLFAKQLLSAIEESGIVVYPDYRTGWHFDDKVGEKYLFEALGLPCVPSFAFYDKKTAIEWINTTAFPKVFKLRGGAGSMNVILVKNRRSAQKLINRAFGPGFKAFRSIDYFKDRYNKWKQGNDSFVGVLKSLSRFIIKPKGSNLLPVQKGYAYFQEFMPYNSYDTRVVVIGCKYALAEKRYVRKGDFRASGSGKFDYDDIDTNLVKIAFDAANKIKAQTLAFDFIYDKNHNGLIVEVSYCFGTHGISHAPGYWDSNLNWHNADDCKIDICGWMVDEVVEAIKSKC